MKESEPKGFVEKSGTITRNAGIIAGVIGIIAAAADLAIGGFGLGASGEILRRLGKKKNG